MFHRWLSIKPFSLVFVLLTLSSVIYHVWGYDLTMSSVDFWECPSIISLSVSTICNTYSFHDTFISSHASISTFQMPHVVEHPLFVKSTFHFHTTQQSRQVLSPYVFLRMKAERFLHEIPVLVKSFFSQCILLLTSRQLLPSSVTRLPR